MDDRITDEPSELWGEITDKLREPAGVVPPWARPGAFRYDAEPHRGHLLRGLGMVAVLAGALSGIGPAVIAFGPLALALGLLVWTLGRRDLGRIRQGRIDPQGEPLIQEAKDYGGVALGIAAFFVVFWGVLFACILFLDQ